MALLNYIMYLEYVGALNSFCDSLFKSTSNLDLVCSREVQVELERLACAHRLL